MHHRRATEQKMITITICLIAIRLKPGTGGVIGTSPLGVLILLSWWTYDDGEERLDGSRDDSFPHPPITARHCGRDRVSLAIMQSNSEAGSES